MNDVFSVNKADREIIEKIVPLAKAWNDTQWSDKHFVYSTVETTCGDGIAYVDIMFLLGAKQRYSHRGYLDALLRFKNMTPQLMSFVWPNTKEDLYDIFGQILKEIDANISANHGNAYKFEADLIEKSWLYKQLDVWKDGNDPIDKSIKKALFDFHLQFA